MTHTISVTVRLSSLFPFIFVLKNVQLVWSNFEIADLDFFRSPHYLAFFDYLDKTGNFYYERWGDAPVHSIAAALFLPKSQLHFFNEIGYEHPPFQHCPRGEPHHLGHCSCKFTNNIDYTGYAILFSLFFYG